MDLNAEYGACLPPGRKVEDWEQFNQPSTREELTKESGARLRVYLDSVVHHQISEMLANTTALLWVVDANGAIFFANEETRLRSDLSLAFVFPRRHLRLPEHLIKLGHPALLEKGAAETKVARCGGDITYDPALGGRSPWAITFNSGRYGNRTHLTAQHLEAVAKRFEDTGVAVTPYF